MTTTDNSGLPAFALDGWLSPELGKSMDAWSILDQCEYISGPEITRQERIVIIDIWATWCGPCIEAASELSDLAEKHAGQIAIVGVNNDIVYGSKEHDIESVKKFVEDKKDKFRYRVVIDNKGHAKENAFKRCGFLALPCIIILVDGTITYVGPHEELFSPAVDKALAAIKVKEE